MSGFALIMSTKQNKKMAKKKSGPVPKGLMWDNGKGYVPIPDANQETVVHKTPAPAHRPPKDTEWDGVASQFVYVKGHLKAGQLYEKPTSTHAPNHRPPVGTEWDGAARQYVYIRGHPNFGNAYNKFYVVPNDIKWDDAAGRFLYVENHPKAGEPYDESYRRRPPGRPPLGTEWDGAAAHYVYVTGHPKFGEPYDESYVPPFGTEWNDADGQFYYVDGHLNAGEPYDESYVEIQQPLGRPPLGTEWDELLGQYLYVAGHENTGEPYDQTLLKRKASVTTETPYEDGPGTKKGRRFEGRTFQKAWARRLPWLTCVSGVDEVMKAQPDTDVAVRNLVTNTFVCPNNGPDCPGCAKCSRLFCSLCQEREIDVIFARGGCADFRGQVISKHANTHHKTDLDDRQSSILDGLEKMLQLDFNKLKAIFDCVYFLAEENLPLWKTKPLARLMGRQGVNLGKKYVNHVMARDILMSIAHVLRERLNDWANRSVALALMVDEATDVSTTSSMVLYLRSNIGGVFKTFFWGLVKIDDAMAKGLMEVIIRHFEENEVAITKLASLATDGASVMMGAQNGVCVRLRDYANPYMLIMHCIAHREALAASAAAVGNVVCDFYESLLHQIVNYYSNSSKRKNKLKEIQRVLQVAQLRIVRVVATRWLLRGQCSVRILASIAALISEFKQDADEDSSNSTARGLYEQIFAAKFLCALVLFTEILEKLNDLNRFFQKAKVRFGDVMKNVGAVKEYLSLYDKDYFVGSSKYLDYVTAKKSATEMDVFQLDHDVDSELTAFNWKGIEQIVMNEDDEQWVRRGVSHFAAKLVTNLNERFPEKDSPVVAALDVFNFDEMPTTPEQWSLQKASNGDAQIQTLLEHFGVPTSVGNKRFEKKVDPGVVRSEWPMFRELMFKLRCAVYCGEMNEDAAYDDLLRTGMFKDTKFLLRVFLVRALSSVPCERGFSTMSIVKGKLRNCLSVKTVDALMMVHLNGPKEKDYPNDFEAYQKAHDDLIERAIEHWKEKKKRNANKSHPGIAGRKKKKPASRTLAEALEDEISEARRRKEAVDGPRLDETEPETDDEDYNRNATMDEEEEEEEEEEGEEDDEEEDVDDEAAQHEYIEQHGPFTPPPDWRVKKPPASTEEEWVNLQNTKSFCRDKFWKGKKYGHLWSNGWAVATYKKKYKNKHYFFYGGTAKMEYSHTIKLDDYGITKTWVIIEKIPARQRAS